jgi:hypothetical protein
MKRHSLPGRNSHKSSVFVNRYMGRPWHSSCNLILKSHHRTLGSIPGYFMQYMWSMKRQWKRFFSGFLWFPLLIVTAPLAIIIYHRPLRCAIAVIRQHIITSLILRSFISDPALGWLQSEEVLVYIQIYILQASMVSTIQSSFLFTVTI